MRVQKSKSRMYVVQIGCIFECIYIDLAGLGKWNNHMKILNNSGYWNITVSILWIYQLFLSMLWGKFNEALTRLCADFKIGYSIDIDFWWLYIYCITYFSFESWIIIPIMLRYLFLHGIFSQDVGQ